MINLDVLKRRAVKALQREERKLGDRMNEVRHMLEAFGERNSSGPGRPGKRRKMSAAGRRAISLAQKVRWRAKKAKE
jgi:hypothetical protein